MFQYRDSAYAGIEHANGRLGIYEHGVTTEENVLAKRSLLARLATAYAAPLTVPLLSPRVRELIDFFAIEPKPVADGVTRQIKRRNVTTPLFTTPEKRI